MTIYRITSEIYKDDISGNGASIYGARWNSVGKRMVYTSEHISLGILESLVHFTKNQIPQNLYLLHILLPNNIEVSEISLEKIKDKWANHIDYTQWIGDNFIENNQSLILKVPSVVVPEESNFLLNPIHKDFKKITIQKFELLQLDERLMNIKQ